jgi:hypothetical protein
MSGTVCVFAHRAIVSDGIEGPNRLVCLDFMRKVLVSDLDRDTVCLNAVFLVILSPFQEF